MISFSIIVGAISVLFAFILRANIKRLPEGDARMREIAEAIREGSYAFLKRQYKTVGIVAIVLAFILWFGLTDGGLIAAGFIVGALFSAFAGFFGMETAVMANVRTTEAAKSGIRKAFTVAFRGGAVTGFLVAGLALLSVTIFYKISDGNLAGLIGLSFGGSLSSVFARLG